MKLQKDPVRWCT